MKNAPVMNKKALMLLVNTYRHKGLIGLTSDLQTLEDKLTLIPSQHKSNTWLYNIKKFKAFTSDGITSDHTNLPFTLFNKNGNKKLPFYTFSSLPLFTCNGAFECAKFCYSLKAWRYPSAFFRQFMSFILMIERKDIIADAFQTIKTGADLRLYVDGDFSSVEDLQFWFDQLKTRPDIQSYGYSKSWNYFLEYKGKFPDNYRLNLSSGSRYTHLKPLMELLPCTRGEFIAVPSKVKQTSTNWKEYANEVRQSAKNQGYNKVFVCPSVCGSCTGKGHACGLMALKNVAIAIGIH